MILPSCQDTGSAIVMAKKGQYVWTSGDDEAAISKGIYQTYTQTNLRSYNSSLSHCVARVVRVMRCVSCVSCGIHVC
jgi:tartrate dehydratase alpha subunit/fumarate hydratase class I-like protein